MLSGDEPEDPLDDDQQPDFNIGLDLIQMTLLMIIMRTSFQMTMDHHLTMT